MPFETKDLINANSTDQFFNQLANLQGPQERPRPIKIRLNGDTGEWSESVWSEAQKKMDAIPWKRGEREWGAAILMVKYFAKEKYREGYNGPVRRTREFTWDEPIKLLKIDYQAKENGTQEIGEYPDYQSFKAAIAQEYGHAVNEAIRAKKEIPKQDEYTFDLWVSIYLYDFEKDRICNLQVKGMSRKAVFDYMKSWKRGMPETVASYSQVLTKFSSVHYTEPRSFYSMKLQVEDVLSEPHQMKVKEAVMALGAWMRSFKTEEVKEEAKAEIRPDEDINLSDIPF